MATVTEKPQPPKPPQPAEQQLVDQQISRTRRALKSVDVAAGLITLAIGVLAFLLTMSVLEHWVIPGGWSDSARFVLFACADRRMRVVQLAKVLAAAPPADQSRCMPRRRSSNIVQR